MRVEKAIAEKSLHEFTKQGWRYIDPSPFKDNWHLEEISAHLEDVLHGRCRRLIFNMPPRHMKSIGTSVMMPAYTWAMKRDPRYPLIGPQVRFLCLSYAATLSVRDSGKTRRLIKSSWYQERWGKSFTLLGDQDAKIRYDNDQGGYRIASSFDGQITGDGGDIIIVDDPHNVADGESVQVRARTIQTWDEALQSRLNDPQTGVFIVIMQRVHERDLTGHILAKEENGYRVVCLPAYYEPDHPYVYSRDPRKEAGEPLWKNRFGKAELDRLATDLGSYAAAGQLQQRPAPREGGMFKIEHLQFLPARPIEGWRWVRAWDLAATQETGKNDPSYTVGALIGRGPQGQTCVADIRRGRYSDLSVMKLMRTTAELDGVQVKIVIPQDPGQAGKAQARSLIAHLAGFDIRAKLQSGDKETRASPFSAQVEAGNVFVVKAPWNQAFVDELVTFPNGAHDDQVDASSEGFNMLNSTQAGVVALPGGDEQANYFRAL